MRYLMAVGAVAALLAGPAQPARAQIPDDLQAGYEAYKAGHFQDAVDAFGRAIEHGGLTSDAMAVTLNNRGVASSQLGNLDSAIADYLQAQTIKADDPTTTRNLRFAYLTRGLGSAKTGDRDSALADYDRALAIDPNYVDALQYRGALQVEMGARDKAVADFRRVLTLEPDNRTAVAALGALQGEPAGTGGSAAPVGSTSSTAATVADPAEDAVARSKVAEERAQAALDNVPDVAEAPAPAAGPQPPASTGDQAEAMPGPSITAADDATDVAVPTAPVSKPTAPEASRQATAEVPAPPPPEPAAGRTAGADGAASAELGQFRANTSVNVRAGPANSFAVVGSLARNQLVASDSEKLGWYRVLKDGKRVGWVYRRFLDPAE